MCPDATMMVNSELAFSQPMACRNPCPLPPPAWAPVLHDLSELSSAPVLAPPWWTAKTAFFGGLATRTEVSSEPMGAGHSTANGDLPILFCQLTLAGWGDFEAYGRACRRAGPGTGLLALVPSRHRCGLPKDSPGWTFGWLSIQHPYLVERIARALALRGPLIQLEPSDPIALQFVRLLRGAIKKDFRDRFDAELALVEFAVACERTTQRGQDQGQQLLDEIRARVLAALPNVADVSAMAADYRMSRTNFSHYFRTRTGQTPAHFAMTIRVEEAGRLLRQTDLALKQVAAACGFGHWSHFWKVFRRFHHLSPAAYRRAVA